MTLLWTLAAIALAFGIARYNRSNKLFWQLALAFIGGYAAYVMCTRTSVNEKGKMNLTQVCPTQVPVVTSSSILYLLADSSLLNVSTKVTASTPVSQVYTPAKREIRPILSEVYGRTRDQPQQTLIKPPELWYQKAISTLHDST